MRSPTFFIEAYRNLERYQAGTNFFAWLCAIARNRLLAEAKRLQRQTKNQQSYLDRLLSERLIAFAAEPTELSDLRLQLLQECLAELPPQAASILNQRYAGRIPVELIAQALGRTASAVSVQLFALRQKLRQCIDRKGRAAVLAEN